MVAWGWKMRGQTSGPVALLVMAIVFWVDTRDDPELAERRKAASSSEPNQWRP
jgi:NNP family nitrate/nitrite transporter-like MFS transporter